MHAMCLETPVGGAQHLWVLDRGIVKRLRIHPTLKQLEWLVLASPMALLPVEVTIVRWHNGAFEADVHSIHVLPHTKQRVPPYKGTLRMTRRIYSRK